MSTVQQQSFLQRSGGCWWCRWKFPSWGLWYSAYVLIPRFVYDRLCVFAFCNETTYRSCNHNENGNGTISVHLKMGNVLSMSMSTLPFFFLVWWNHGECQFCASHFILQVLLTLFTWVHLVEVTIKLIVPGFVLFVFYYLEEYLLELITLSKPISSPLVLHQSWRKVEWWHFLSRLTCNFFMNYANMGQNFGEKYHM